MRTRRDPATPGRPREDGGGDRRDAATAEAGSRRTLEEAGRAQLGPAAVPTGLDFQPPGRREQTPVTPREPVALLRSKCNTTNADCVPEAMPRPCTSGAQTGRGTGLAAATSSRY